MTRRTPVLLQALALVVLVGCSRSTTDAEILLAGDLEGSGLTAGTSFGHCIGLCATELVIGGGSVTLTETSRTGTPAPRVRTLPLSDLERARLAAALDPAALRRLEGVHGCPDCADGGAEWIQIGPATDPVRVTFEFGADLAPIAPLQAEIRALRDRFDP